jgi:hypothetical protein
LHRTRCRNPLYLAGLLGYHVYYKCRATRKERPSSKSCHAWNDGAPNELDSCFRRALPSVIREHGELLGTEDTWSRCHGVRTRS